MFSDSTSSSVMMKMAKWCCLLLILLLTNNVADVEGYLPGVGPTVVDEDQPLPLFVNELTSIRTQIPFDYYSLPFCQPHVKYQSENLGEVLEGERKVNSVYELTVNKMTFCRVACARTLKKKEAYDLMKAIDDDYTVHMTVDGLPSAREIQLEDGNADSLYVKGFPVGFHSGEGVDRRHYLYNHLRIKIGINSPNNNNKYHVVGFIVEPFSVAHTFSDGSSKYVEGKTALSQCDVNGYASADPAHFLQIHKTGTQEVIYSYDVLWEVTTMPWTQRWDLYLSANPGDQIHWFSITNSALIVMFLTVLVAMILIRALRKDIQNYNQQDIEDAKEETGWKLVHGDVFRAPEHHPMLFAVCVGTGVQLLVMTFLVILFALLGLLSPAQRGNILTCTMLLFVLMGSFAGYHAARIHKMFRGANWIKMTTLTAVTYPGFCFTIFFILNIALSIKGSTGAVPFGTLCVLLFLWLLVQAPLVFAGSYLGFKKESPDHPVRTNQIPRMIRESPWYISPWVAMPFSGILPFGAVSVELFFIMTSVWLDQLYYIFGFLMLVLIILVVTCAEISIVLCYFQLCAEDYRWWWRSLLWSGSCASYLFLYATWYYFAELQMTGLVSTLLYFGYMSVISVSFFLLTGTVGYFSCYWFITKIYSSIKVD